MEIYKDDFELSEKDKIIFTLGMFDGVHLGHRFVLNFLNEIAEKENGQTAVMTFDPHPRFVLQPNTDLKLINTLNEKIDLLKELNVQHLLVQKFNKEFSQLSASEFVQNILVKKLKIYSLVVGHDHQFGKNRDGNFEQLEKLSKIYNFNLYQLPSISENNTLISSTKIRNLISDGNIELANQWLGYKFMLTGKVIEGNKLGRTIGFPTANLEINEQKINPKNGVYFVKVKIDNDLFDGMLNIGIRPTVNGLEKQIEVHILNFNQNIYGKNILVYFYKRERDEKKFSSIDELKNQLNLDKEKTEKYFSII